jgi:uncharacterized phage-associated protein
MKSLDVANYLIDKHGAELTITNLKLNKLVYFTQVEALRKDGRPLFDDCIQAWEYGPVEPAVYFAFNQYGSNTIPAPTKAYDDNSRMREIVAAVVRKFGNLTAFDLVRLSHRPGGAWYKAYSPKENVVISNELIMASSDIRQDPPLRFTLADGIETVNRSWPNALRMLENS